MNFTKHSSYQTFNLCVSCSPSHGIIALLFWYPLPPSLLFCCVFVQFRDPSVCRCYQPTGRSLLAEKHTDIVGLRPQTTSTQSAHCCYDNAANGQKHFYMAACLNVAIQKFKRNAFHALKMDLKHIYSYVERAH